jgi:hypothetical protein
MFPCKRHKNSECQPTSRYKMDGRSVCSLPSQHQTTFTIDYRMHKAPTQTHLQLLLGNQGAEKASASMQHLNRPSSSGSDLQLRLRGAPPPSILSSLPRYQNLPSTNPKWHLGTNQGLFWAHFSLSSNLYMAYSNFCASASLCDFNSSKLIDPGPEPLSLSSTITLQISTCENSRPRT